jgi:hypothetical protein
MASLVSGWYSYSHRRRRYATSQANVRSITPRRGCPRNPSDALAVTAWPGVTQVFRLVRERTKPGRTTGPGVRPHQFGAGGGDAARLLGLSRGHWGSETGMHAPPDETFREDRCRVRRGNAPRVLASLRNIAAHLLRTTDHPSLPAAPRNMVARPALAMINAPHSTSESP